MYKLSPSDFAYLYEECKLCYWLKVKKGVFSAINTRIQGTLIGKNLQSLSADLPQAVVKTQEGWVESKLVPETGVYIKGKYDLLAQAADGGNFLVDLKISQPHEDKIDKYKTQLSAYKFALENPKSGVGVKIARMGLLIFYPDAGWKFPWMRQAFWLLPERLTLCLTGRRLKKGRAVSGANTGIKVRKRPTKKTRSSSRIFLFET